MGRKILDEANGIVTRKLVPIFSMILLIILSVALFVTPVGAETVNETVQIDNYFYNNSTFHGILWVILVAMCVIFVLWMLLHIILPCFNKVLEDLKNYIKLGNKAIFQDIQDFLFKKQDLPSEWLFFIISYIIIVPILLFFDILILFDGGYDSALYLLSAMIQSLATILTIMVTVTFVIAQIASQKYASIVVEKIVRENSFILLLVLFIVGIGWLIFILSNLEQYMMAYPFFPITSMDIAVFIFILCLLFLGYYISSIILFLKPTKILEVIGKDVKKESVILAHKDKKRSDFVVKEDDESDPLQPLRDIANNAISMSNHEVARLAINKIVEKGIELLKDEKDKDDAAKIAEHFVYHLEKIGTNAVSSKDPDFIDLVIGAMDSIAKTSKTDGGMKPFIQSLGYIGRECAEENMIVISDTSNDDIIYVIKNLGILAVDNGFTGENSSSQAAIFKIHEIGSILLKKEFKFLLIGSIVSVLKEIAEQGIKKEKRSVVSYAVENIASYALSAIDFPPFHKFVTKDGIDALKSIAIYSDKAGLKSIKPQVIEDLEKILKKADEKGLDEVVTHAEKAITELKGNTKSDDSLEGQN